jgi:hypothetical protein
MRQSTLLWAVLGIAVVIGLFVVKHRVQDLEDRLHALNAEIITDRDAIQVMQAEWSYLNQPARLEALSKRLLGMETPVADQTVSMQELLRIADPDSAILPPATEVAKKSTPAPSRRTAQRPAPQQVKTPAQNPILPNTQGDDWLGPILATLKKSQ